MSGTYTPNPLRDLIAQAIGMPSPSQQEGMPASLLGQLLIAERQATAAAAPPDPNRTAVDTLLSIGGGPQASDVAAGPPGAPSTGSVRGDIAAAHAAGLTQAALGIAANPMGLATTVPATLAAIGLNAITGVPAKSLSSVFGMRGLATQLAQVPTAIQNAVMGLPEKPEGFGVEEGGPKADAPEKADLSFDAADFGGALGTPEATSDGAPSSDTGGDKGSTSGDVSSDSPLKKGGLVKHAQGGSVIELQGGGKIAVGPGGGLDDLIPTSINGRRAAALSDGEFVIPADVVSMLGDGSSNAGSRRLYDLVRQIREAKTGTSEQAGPLPVGEILRRTMS